MSNPTDNRPQFSSPQAFAPPTSTAAQLDPMGSRGQAMGKGTVRFTHSPMRVEDIGRKRL